MFVELNPDPEKIIYSHFTCATGKHVLFSVSVNTHKCVIFLCLFIRILLHYHWQYYKGIPFSFQTRKISDSCLQLSKTPSYNWILKSITWCKNWFGHFFSDSLPLSLSLFFLLSSCPPLWHATHSDNMQTQEPFAQTPVWPWKGNFLCYKRRRRPPIVPFLLLFFFSPLSLFAIDCTIRCWILYPQLDCLLSCFKIDILRSLALYFIWGREKKSKDLWLGDLSRVKPLFLL